ncbi:hypothetical protein FRZ67_07955 [Panacibacter ginsenosidivorans]|uniref:Uncharacterized protein n=1 Tax=Panacibacter ginsenosidivorans TaxID=1813871 RepID=A0A5B8V8R3_9BACT|nr:hypothetical protein [Panacibacter ginsenosidivorans]QEC67231.1 hypothetical protein FRZ67_07955 [Panacibacter ginsenosidivorans]
MKSIIYIPIFFLAMLLALIVYDGINAINMRNDMLLKEDRIHFHSIVVKAGHTHYHFNIDSFHYVVFVQPHDHEERSKMLDDMDTTILVFAERLQILP